MNVIGLDLSINGTGICVADKSAETIAGKSADGDRRLARIHHATIHYTRRVGANMVGMGVVELNPPHAHSGDIMQLVHGAARTALAIHQIPFAYVAPSALKVYATGESTADKTAMMVAVQQITGWRPADDNQADAWWLRQMGLDALGMSNLDLPESQRRALRGVSWPGLVTPWGAAGDRSGVRTMTCRHKVTVMLSGVEWVHPFTLDVCDKPPK